MKRYRKAAEQGDPDAQYNLARCYSDGDGMEKDLNLPIRRNLRGHWLRNIEAGDGSVSGLSPGQNAEAYYRALYRAFSIEKREGGF